MSSDGFLQWRCGIFNATKASGLHRDALRLRCIAVRCIALPIDGKRPLLQPALCNTAVK